MRRFLSLAGAAMVAFSASGCAVGGFGAIGPVASAPPPAAAPAVVYGGFLEGPVGQKLSPGDRDRALAATQDALSSGQRKTWKGDNGVFGFVEPAAGDQADGGSCRAFTSTIYISGRPQVGRGRGCPGPDGAYRVVA